MKQTTKIVSTVNLEHYNSNVDLKNLVNGFLNLSFNVNAKPTIKSSWLPLWKWLSSYILILQCCVFLKHSKIDFFSVNSQHP